MSLVLIGDVGVENDTIHIGDEAMFEEFVVQARSHGISHVTGISSAPADTAARYGVDAIERIGFGFTGPDARLQMRDRRESVLRAAAGDRTQLADDDTAWAVIDAIRSADGVAVAGGGNLASTWPLHIAERGTIGALAKLFGRPLVVSGQTIGPELTLGDTALVAQLLSSATLVGLREATSRALTERIGVDPAKLTHTVDDASFLGSATGIRPAILVTFSTHLGGADRDAVITRAAELLDGLAERTGLAIEFLAHFGSTVPGIVKGDAVLHAAIAERMSAPATQITPTTAMAAADLARTASLVLTSRYHPAVFATAAGVPTIGISVDEYTTVKLTGALGNFGQSSVLPITGLVAGDGPVLAERVWADRDAIRAAAEPVVTARAAESAEWWDRVFRAIGR
ncbi:polysaccharide pyruvyl transferase family protein [Lacisediminihabitans changchengi]|uniref:Polysaccharide pyruvyl transferase family protein n=1 Tax=Lacisediminihabitans changchengi TaxID=2787634 RepID=A0A934W1U9_9MICO|nr:polysaccharide pyruvyl transferase family protein [Lacisediminihabitans changchengi]MBK4347253.1 polysaccharide pyruvyl transferase family protein [Lacisediminihabitans changchengi]